MVTDVPTVNEYSQLVTPHAFYLMSIFFRGNMAGVLNSFGLPGPTGGYSAAYWKTLGMLGVRYAATIAPLPASSNPGFPPITKPFRPREIDGKPGDWHIYELPHPNVGNYSPVEVVSAETGADIAAAWNAPDLDFQRQVILSAPITTPLVAASDMRLSIVRGGLHISGRSEGTSVVILPQQFSHCLRATTGSVRFMRANLIATAMVFSGNVDTDIISEYGMFSSACRRADLAELRQLDLKIDRRMPHLSSDRLFYDWGDAAARLRAAVHAIR